MNLDWSTINLEILRRQKRSTLPPTYRLQRDPGNACYGDPPGYPTYFTQSVYTQHGNTPSRGPETVILYEGVCYITAHSADWRPGDDWDKVHSRRAALLRSLWLPLPLDHPRTRQWIARTYQHFAHCYRDEERPEYGRPGTLIYPVPGYKRTKPGHRTNCPMLHTANYMKQREL